MSPLSKDASARKRQLANISRTEAGKHPAVKHGARSPAIVDPLADEHYKRLSGQLPTADPELLAVQARRLAQMGLLQAWIAKNGLLQRSPKGTVYNAAEYHEKLASAFERMHLVILDREREQERIARTREAAGIVVDAIPDEERRQQVLLILGEVYGAADDGS
jgi:hypothetical protein